MTFADDWQTWKTEREKSLADPYGWLALVSLDWLETPHAPTTAYRASGGKTTTRRTGATEGNRSGSSSFRAALAPASRPVTWRSRSRAGAGT